MSTRFTALAASVALVPAALLAQQPASNDTTTKPAAPAPAPAAAPTPAVAPAIDFSGVIFGNFQYRGDAGANQGTNKFDVERAYLTFKMPAGDRASIRVTTDVFQQTNGSCTPTTVTTTSGTVTVPCTAADAYYKGWVVRAKYAYLNYTLFKNADWKVDVRPGIIQTAVIDQIENFFPRYISQMPEERAGLFSSADVGAASLISLPNKMGELYVGVANGPGYSSRETDRFKDYSARLTLNPLANNADAGLLKGLALIGWYYKGTLASKFVSGGTGQVGPVREGLQRDRWGAFAGIKDPRLTFGVDFAQRMDEGETGANTTASPRAVVDSTGRLISVFGTLKPFQLSNKNGLPLGIVARYDQVKPNTSTDPRYYLVIAGLTWDLTKKTAIALDYQETTPQNGAPSSLINKTYYLHWVANF